MSRKTRREKATRSQEPVKKSLWKRWLFVVLLASAILALVITSTNTPKQQHQIPVFNGGALGGTVSKPLSLMLPQSTDEQKREALQYSEQFIVPVLIKHMTDPKELPAISNRLRFFSIQNKAGLLAHMVVPVRNPWMGSSVAKFGYDTERGIFEIMVFVPQVKQDKQEYEATGRPQDFEDYLVLSYAHEVIHFENMKKNPSYESSTRLGWPDRHLMLQEEVEAWGVTIIEIVRPLLAQGRYVPKNMADASGLLKEYGDNYLDPKWVTAFESYHPK